MKASSIDFVRKEFIWGCKEKKRKKKEEAKTQYLSWAILCTVAQQNGLTLPSFSFLFFFYNLIVATVETKFKL